MTWTAARVRRALHDRLDGPGVARRLDAWHRIGVLSQELAAEFVAEAWDLCAWPMSVLPRARWVALFRFAGYTHEFRLASPPTETLRLYRGSDPRGREGLCWSTSVDVARYMALRFPVGMVWVAEVEPGRLLAYLDEGFERQFVVDTTGLAVDVWESPAEVVALDEVELLLRLDRPASSACGGVA